MPRPPVKPHVAKHLKKNNVDPNDLPDAVIEALNVCSGPELQHMDNVGARMEDANVDLQLRAFAFH
jgi:hypothetical protein